MFKVTAFYSTKQVSFYVAANSQGQALVKAHAVACKASSIVVHSK
jgi:hypothetical protein